MESTISMQDMRYLNLFERITHVNTRFCFIYNDTIYFCVPKHLVAKAIGEQGRNVKEMYGILRKKIKVIPFPQGIYHAKPFIEAIVYPITFRNVEEKGDEIVLTAGTTQSKAMLLGREKRRLAEMQGIIRNFFGKEFRII
ncbi:MAG TPA: hypothetical protein VMC07_02955 [Candidatus Omnitrophota bacterium]|nr:hypothetical protein [Candidatus Omnitrophota bacterium]